MTELLLLHILLITFQTKHFLHIAPINTTTPTQYQINLEITKVIAIHQLGAITACSTIKWLSIQ